MKNKKEIFYSILGLILLVISAVEISFAFFTYTKEGSINNSVQSGEIFFDFTEKNGIEIINAMPDTHVSDTLEFKVIGRNQGTNPIYYTVYAIPGDEQVGKTLLKDEEIKLTLTSATTGNITVDKNNFSVSKKIGGADNSKRNDGNLILATGTLGTTSTNAVARFTLKMELNKDLILISDTDINADYCSSGTTDTSEYLELDKVSCVSNKPLWNKTYYSLKIKVNGTTTTDSTDNVLTINDIVKIDQLDNEIKFYEISSSSNGEGLYMMSSTKDDTYPIYYYRGNVNNNNIYFAESCWKIVRTTSTGGAKLIYNGEATEVSGKKQCLETTGVGTQLPITSAFNSSYNSPAYVGYGLPLSNNIYTYSKMPLSSGVYYGSSINPTTYELVDPQITLDNNHHYSYNSTDIHATGIEGDIGNVRYYYYYYPQGSTGNNGYFITFSKTQSIQTVLNEMLSEPVSKNNPSTIQSYINTWWSNYDTAYGSYLEDTEWCNDRSIGDLGGFNPNGGNLTKYLFLSPRIRYDQSQFGSNLNNIKNVNVPNLTCNNQVDRLTVSNGSLTYKIGLLTMDEVVMAGARYSTINSNYYLYTSEYYWLLSPSYFYYDSAVLGDIYSDGNLFYNDAAHSKGVRPSLSLKYGTKILDGDGTKENPYIVGE